MIYCSKGCCTPGHWGLNVRSSVGREGALRDCVQKVLGHHFEGPSCGSGGASVVIERVPCPSGTVFGGWSYGKQLAQQDLNQIFRRYSNSN